jgi:hypothetical protein
LEVLANAFSPTSCVDQSCQHSCPTLYLIRNASSSLAKRRGRPFRRIKYPNSKCTITLFFRLACFNELRVSLVGKIRRWRLISPKRSSWKTFQGSFREEKVFRSLPFLCPGQEICRGFQFMITETWHAFPIKPYMHGDLQIQNHRYSIVHL